MRKILLLVLSFALVLTAPIAALEARSAPSVDARNITANYVQELVDLDIDEIPLLTDDEANRLFEKAFEVSASTYSEAEVRTALTGLSYALKFEQLRKISPSSTKSGNYYDLTDPVGAAWIRDTTKSPITLGEALTGYTLEVDYLTRQTAVSILGLSKSYSLWNTIMGYLMSGLPAEQIGEYILTQLKITGNPKLFTLAVISIAASFGYDYFASMDRTNMQNCVNNMDEELDLIRVYFTWNAVTGTLARIYTIYRPPLRFGKTILLENPFPEMYGEWRFDEYSVLYSY